MGGEAWGGRCERGGLERQRVLHVTVRACSSTVAERGGVLAAHRRDDRRPGASAMGLGLGLGLGVGLGLGRFTYQALADQVPVR